MIPSIIQNLPSVLLLLGSVIVLYIASAAAAGAIGGNAIRQALGFSIGSAGVGLVAAAMGQAGIALSAVLGSAICSLSLILGLFGSSVPVAFRNETTFVGAFPLVLPVALAVLLAGMSGKLTLTHAAILLLASAAVVPVWNTSAGDRSDAQGNPNEPPPPDQPIAVPRLAMACLLAVIAGWGATRGVTTLSTSIRGMPAPLLVAMSVAAAPVLPAFVYAMRAARRGRSDEGTAAIVATAVINLGVVLPLAIIVWHARQSVSIIDWPVVAVFSSPLTTQPATMPATMSTAAATDPTVVSSMPFPMAMWRVEAVVLVVLGMALIPIALGRVQLGQLQSMALVGAYAVYLVMVAAGAALWG